MLALRAGYQEDFPGLANPFGVPALDGVLDGIEALAKAVVPLVLVAGLASLVVRYQRGDPTLRRQLQWIGFAAGALVAVDVVADLALGGGLDNHPAYCTWGTTATKPVYGTVVPPLLYTGLPVAVAVLRHRLYDIDRLVRRSAVYATLWGAIAVAYLAVAWALGVAVTGRLPVAAGVLVTIVITVVSQPVRRRMEHAADRWVFGRRPSGYELASELGADVAGAGGLDDVARSLAQIVQRGLALEWARVSLELTDGREPVTAEAVSGAMAGDAEADLSVPVMHLDRRMGTIDCGPALDRRPASERHALLELLAHEAALAAELAASRARIVTAQEAERRRVERDIHDGAQQELVAMIAKLRIARELSGRDQEAALATLEEVQRDAQSALRGIRELAQGIHPSVLGDQGLVAAIEDRTARLPLQVSVVAEPVTRTSRFPNPIEGAAFFVVSEALANVLKHAGATRATVGVRRQNGTLIVEVRDDGCGFDPGQSQGDGLTRLADRVGALGGRLHVHSSPGTGAVVTAVLPAGAQHDGG